VAKSRRQRDREKGTGGDEPAPGAGLLERLNSPRVYWPVFAGVLLLASVIRCVNLGAESLWLDELWTEEVATGRGSVHLTMPMNRVLDPPPATTRLDGAPAASAWRVWGNMKDVTHPPLYFVALGAWRWVFGGSDLAARGFTVVCFALALLALFDTARRMNGAFAALVACLLMALAAPMVEYGQTVRNYAFLLAAALGGANVLVRIAGDNAATWPRLALLSLALLAAALSHYFAAGTLLAMFAWAMMRFRGVVRLKALGAFVIAGLLFAAAWGPFMLRQVERFATEDPTTVFLARQGTEQLLYRRHSILALLALPNRWLIEPPSEMAMYAVCLGAVLWTVPAWALVRRRPETLFWTLWLAGTVGVVALLDFTRSTTHLVYPRYTLLAAPALYVLLPAVFAGASGVWRALVPVVGITIAALGLLTRTRPPYPDWRGLAAYVDQRAGPSDVLAFIAPGKPEWSAGYMYMALTHYSAHPRRPVLLLQWGTASPALREQMDVRRVWLINGTPEIPPQLLVGGLARGGLPEGAPAAVYELAPTR
jgi:uncharacterized membrane protein